MSLKLVPPPERDAIEAKVNAGTPALLDINMDEITHLKGGSAANGDNSDPVVAQGTAELALRRLIAEFGFDRLPLTFGELNGLRDYCQMLRVVAAHDVLPRSAKYYKTGTLAWQTAAIKAHCRSLPQHERAMRLYCELDREGLLKLHTAENTLAVLGKTYQQFEED